MAFLFRDPLPIKSPHLPSSPFSSPAALFPVLRSRLFVTVTVGVLTFFLLVSYVADIRLPGSGSSLAAFPSHGLKRELWRELSSITLREFVLEPEEVPFVKQTTMEDPVPWSQEHLLPRRADNLKKLLGTGASSTNLAISHALTSSGEPIPRHRIEAFPQKPLLPPGRVYPRGRDLIFGMTTTVERAKQMSELWTRWLLPVVDGDDENRPACMVLLSRDEDPVQIEELRAVLAGRGLNCGLRTSSLERYEVRVLSMAVELRDYADEIGRKFEWYIFNDDDTFWLDQLTLRRMLGKYDTDKMWFVGATTEAKNQLDSFGRMAFGGAGMLVSDPLMKEMYRVWDQCHENWKHIFGGDEMVTLCAALAKGATKQTVTTEEKGLHQFDIPGDTTGVMQSGIPFLNLHHYIGGSWVHLFGYGHYRTDFQQILLIKRVVEFLGGDNMFKRYVFGDGKWLFVNGYSLTIFEEALTKDMMDKMEHTWYDGYRLSFEDRPHIPERHDPMGFKVKQTFYIDEIKVISPTKALFTYVQSDKWDEHFSSTERVRINVMWDGCWNGGPGCETSKKDGGALLA